MGEVFLGEHEKIGTRVAIKMLQPHVSEHTEHVQRFFNEAIAASKITHSGIGKIFDVGFTDAGRAYLVMEFLAGETLAARIRRLGRMPLYQVAEIGKQIASVLDAVHKAGITHRDLKPDNIFIVADSELESGERVKILDFGIAKLADAGGVTMTGAGAMGTPQYMSPEQWKNVKSVDWRADAYSLGCLVFEMASGRGPFLAESVGEYCTKHLMEPAPKLSSIVPTAAALDPLLDRLLEKDPARRPASMKEIGAAFAALTAMREPVGQVAFAQSAASPVAVTLPPTLAPAAPAPPVSNVLQTPHAAITTLGSAASTDDDDENIPTAKKPHGKIFVIGGVLVVAAIATGAVIKLSGDRASQQSNETAAVSSPPPAVAPATPTAMVTPDVAPLTADAAAPAPSARELEVECNQLASTRKWREARACSERISKVDATVAAKLQHVYDLEIENEQTMTKLAEAVSARDLAKAKQQVALIEDESVYSQEAKQALKKLQAELKVAAIDCTKTYSAACKKQFCAANPSAEQCATTTTPATCDADALKDKGMENINMGQHAAALAQFEASLRCKPDSYVLQLAFMESCASQNTGKAKFYYAKLTPAQQSKFKQICIRNHVQLD